MFTEEQAAAYLAGIIDGEGNVSKQNKAISVGNTDYEVVEAIQECCEVLDLNCSVYGPRKPRGNRKPYWEVYIRGRETLQRVLDVVPIRIERKREVLRDQLTRYKTSPRPSCEWLREVYIEKRLTGPQIAKLCDTSNPRVYKWLRQCGIRVRDVTSHKEPPPREWLVEQYTNRKRSMLDIGKEHGVSTTTVWRWLHEYGIASNHPHINEN